MPVGTFRGSRLLFQCPVKRFRSFPVLVLSGCPVYGKQHPAFIDIVQLLFFRLKSQYLPVTLHKVVRHLLGKGSIAGISRDFCQGQQCGQHTAVDIIPGYRFAFPDLFQIPGSLLRSAFFHQPENIGFNAVVRHPSSGSFQLFFCTVFTLFFRQIPLR